MQQLYNIQNKRKNQYKNISQKMEQEQLVRICNPRHESRIFAFCQSDNCYVCEECFQREHRAHPIEYLKFMARDQIKIAKDLEDSLNTALGRFEEDSHNFSKRKLSELITANVKNYYNKLIRDLQISCDGLVQNLHKALSREFDHIEKTVKTLNGYRDRIIVLLANLRQQIKTLEKSILCNQYKWFHEHSLRLTDYQNSCKVIQNQMTNEIRLLEKSFPEIKFRLCCEEITGMIEKNVEIVNHLKNVSSVQRQKSVSPQVSARGRSPNSSFTKSTKSPFNPKIRFSISKETTPIKNMSQCNLIRKDATSQSFDLKQSIIRVAKSKEVSTRQSPSHTRYNSISATLGSSIFCFLEPASSSLIKLSLPSLSTAKINIKTKRTFPEGFGAVEYKNKLFLAGGESSNIIINDCSEINCTSGILTGKCPMLSHRRNHGMLCLFDFTYVVGGYNTASNILSKCEKYNFAMDTWETLPDLNRERNFMACCVVDQKQLYCFGGSALETVRGACSYEWLSLMNSDKWHYAEIALNNGPIPYGAGCIQTGRDEVLIFGGLNETEYFNQTWNFKPSNGSVVILGRLLKAKDAFYQRCPQLIGGQVYCVGFLTKSLHICNLKSYEWKMNVLHL